MNDPPTALVGFYETEGGLVLCRLSMNHPPTALVGFEKTCRGAAVRRMVLLPKQADSEPFNRQKDFSPYEELQR